MSKLTDISLKQMKIDRARAKIRMELNKTCQLYYPYSVRECEFLLKRV